MTVQPSAASWSRKGFSTCRYSPTASALRHRTQRHHPFRHGAANTDQRLDQGVVHVQLALVLGQVAFAMGLVRSEEHTSELQSLMRISYAGFCLKKKKREDNNIKQ